MVSPTGTLRQSLPGHRTALTKRVKEATDLLADDHQVEPDESQQRLQRLSVLRKAIQCSIERLLDHDRRWLEVLQNIEDETLQKEEMEIYEKIALQDPGGVHRQIDDAEMICCEIDVQLTPSTVQASPSTPVQHRLTSSNNGDDDQSTDAHPGQDKVSVKLPKLSLPVFDGDVLQFQEFWSIFKATVHDRSDISKVVKLSYLLPQLKGEARQVSKGYMMKEENYDIIIARLQDRFSRTDDRLVSLLHAELKRIPRCVSKSTRERRKTMDTCERVFRQLEQMGKTLDPGESLVFDLLSKFPPGMVRDLDKRYHVGLYSTLSEVRKTVERQITEEEITSGFLQDLDLDRTPGEKRADRDHRNDRESTFSAQAGARRAGQTGPTCCFCNGRGHVNDQCRTYSTAKKRIQRLRETGRCTRCMRHHPRLDRCDTRIRCCHCGIDGHCGSLCFKRFPDKTAPNISNAGNASQRRKDDAPKGSGQGNSQEAGKRGPVNQAQSVTDTTNFSGSCPKNTLFQTALVVAENLETGARYRVRICLDTLSNRTYITEQAADNLGLSAKSQDQLYVSVFGSKKNITVASRAVVFGLQQSNGKILKIDANTSKIISNTGVLPESWPRQTAQLLDGWHSCLADNPFDTDKTVDVLLGADYAWEVIQGPKVDMNAGGIFLIPSAFGFMLGGQLHYDGERRSNDKGYTMLCLTETSCQYPSDLGLAVTDARPNDRFLDIDEFWNLESVGVKDDPTEDDDAIALDAFKSSVQFENGRYQVGWPWIEDKRRILPDNYGTAFKRFKYLTTRLQTDADLLKTYSAIIRDQQERGFIEEVPRGQEQCNHNIHYLPHHPVFKPSSATTKVRIVYDASSKAHRDDVALNECLYRGPIMLPDLCHILIRFRAGKTIIVSDIEKAFLHVGLREQDRDVTRFLWYKDERNPSYHPSDVAIFRFARVPFGIICSPFLLGATIRHHLENQQSEFAGGLARDIYVDNIISAFPSDKSPLSYYREVKELFEKAGMNLREFSSNSTEVMEMVPAQDRAQGTETRVLGIRWDNSNDDTLSIIRSGKWHNPKDAVTKRQVLKSIASIYDPLGLYQPVIFPAKLFLQQLWVQGKSWDSKLSKELTLQWFELSESIAEIFNHHIPRFVGEVKDSSQIIAFGDASKKGYGCVIYLRTMTENGKWTSNLLFAKSRLAQLVPDKKSPTARKPSTSLPRLELLGASMASTAANFCRNAFSSRSMPVYLFSDSECVIHWLGSKRLLKEFVKRRIEKILSIPDCTFQYVSTHDNPADFLTRGLTCSELIDCPQWWHGPSWLSEPEDKWPKTRLPALSSDAIKELRLENFDDSNLFLSKPDGKTEPFGVEFTHLSHHVTVVANETVGFQPFYTSFEKYSNLDKMIRILRFCGLFMKVRLWDKLSLQTRSKFKRTDEFFNALTSMSPEAHQTILQFLVRGVQASVFAREIAAIQTKSKDSRVSQLNLQLDEAGLLRICSRYEHAELPEDAKYPVLLPKNHPLSVLVVQNVHENQRHVGVSHTLSQLRQQYWIPSGRALVKRVLKSCRHCRLIKSEKAFSLPLMPPWPKERVSKSAPFQYVGVDYFGPMKVKISGQVVKIWGCLFTCLATRAVHIEPVVDCTSSEFFNSFMRFVARRGYPQQMISDNGAQFRLVSILGDKAWKQTPTDESLLSHCARQGVNWKFIVQLAPWQGGHYERLVGVVKSVLKSAAGRRILPWSDLITLMAETEAIVNSRPITYVNSDVDSGFRVLRPMDFLLYRPTNSVPISSDFPVNDLGESGKKLASIWKARERHIDKLWEIWYKDYLLNLRERANLLHRRARSRVDRIPGVGEVVILREDGLPRGSWRMARVTRLIRSADAKIRAAEIKLANGVVLQRTVNFLIPLEVGQGSADQRDVNPIISDEANETDEQFFGFTSDDIQRTAHMLQLYDNESDDEQ